MSDFIGELKEEVASYFERIANLAKPQRDSVAKAESFGWTVLDIKTVRGHVIVTMSSGEKRMRIDANGKRIQEIRI